MRSVVLALCLLARVAHAGDGFDWDVVPRDWELSASTILQGQPAKVPNAGLVLALEHRLESRLWAGFTFGLMAGRQFDDTMEERVELPLQTAGFIAASAHVVLGHWVDTLDGDETIAVGLRGELGNAIVSYEDARTTPIITNAGLYARLGTDRTTGMLSLGWGLVFAGERTWLNLGGLDVRFAVVRNW